MPTTLGMRGFEYRAAADDRLINLANTPTYDTSNLPGDSDSETSAGGSAWSFRAPWYISSGTAEPSTDEYWFHARVYTNTNSATGNDGLVVGTGRNDVEHVAISAEDSTNKITIRVNGTVRATAVSAALSLATWARFHVHVGGDDAGDVISVYMDGNLTTPVVSYTLIGADATALSAVGLPNEFRCTIKSGDGAGRLDDLIAWDPTHANFDSIDKFGEASIAPRQATTTNPANDWSGSAADIDERPNSDAEKITAITVGDIAAFGKDVIAADNVYAVQFFARVTRTGTDAGSNIGLFFDDGVDNVSVTIAAPVDGRVSHLFDTAPDGSPWSPTSFDDSEFGFEAIT